MQYYSQNYTQYYTQYSTQHYIKYCAQYFTQCTYTYIHMYLYTHSADSVRLPAAPTGTTMPAPSAMERKTATRPEARTKDALMAANKRVRDDAGDLECPAAAQRDILSGTEMLDEPCTPPARAANALVSSPALKGDKKRTDSINERNANMRS